LEMVDVTSTVPFTNDPCPVPIEEPPEGGAQPQPEGTSCGETMLDTGEHAGADS